MKFENIDTATFTSIEQDQLSFGFSSSAYWLRLTLNSDSTKQWLMKSCYTQIDEFDVFVEESNGWKTIKTGDSRAFNSRDLSHPCFVFKLPKKQIQTVYLRTQSSGSLNLPIDIVSEEYFWHENMGKELLYGIYFAILLTMVLYNLFLFFIIHDPAYFFYVGYLGSIALLLGSMSGHAFMYLWPTLPQWANLSATFFAVFSIATGLQFVKHLGNINQYSIFTSKLIDYVSLLSFITLGIAFVDYSLSLKILMLFTLATTMLFITVVYISLKSGWKPAYFILMGLVALLPGIILLTFQVLGWIESTWWTRNTLHIGTAIEAILLSFALAYRIRILNDELDTHKQKVMNIQSQFSQSLLKAADQERRSLAREIHDGVAQGLLTVKGRVSRIQDSSTRDQILLQLKQSLAEIRNLSKKMHPQQLETLGLATAVESMFRETLNPLGIQTHFKLEDVSEILDKDTELQLYRISQEALNNIVKHANASLVKLLLSHDHANVHFIIEDDGLGLNQAEKKGMGMLNMKERAALINADLKINDLPTGGTKVEIKLACK